MYKKMGCCCSKSKSKDNQQPLHSSASAFPKLSKVWRTFNHNLGYTCSTCKQEATCKQYIVLTCHPSDHFVKNNEWHHHCVQKRKVVAECAQGHLSTHLVKTACECGWKNGEELFE